MASRGARGASRAAPPARKPPAGKPPAGAKPGQKNHNNNNNHGASANNNNNNAPVVIRGGGGRPAHFRRQDSISTALEALFAAAPADPSNEEETATAVQENQENEEREDVAENDADSIEEEQQQREIEIAPAQETEASPPRRQSSPAPPPVINPTPSAAPTPIPTSKPNPHSNPQPAAPKKVQDVKKAAPPTKKSASPASASRTRAPPKAAGPPPKVVTKPPSPAKEPPPPKGKPGGRAESKSPVPRGGKAAANPAAPAPAAPSRSPIRTDSLDRKTPIKASTMTPPKASPLMKVPKDLIVAKKMPPPLEKRLSASHIAYRSMDAMKASALVEAEKDRREPLAKPTKMTATIEKPKTTTSKAAAQVPVMPVFAPAKPGDGVPQLVGTIAHRKNSAFGPKSVPVAAGKPPPVPKAPAAKAAGKPPTKPAVKR